MKKVVALLLSLTLVVSMFAGCGKKEEATTEPKTEETTPAEETTPEPATADAAKTGLAIMTAVDKSADAGAVEGSDDGLAQADSTVVAVLVDKDGKILDCSIDMAQTQVTFSKEGKLITDVATVFPSKQDIGEAYGMKKASKIGKEWNEQASALADYVVGKTIDEVKGIAVTAEGVPADADLASSVTIHIGGYLAAIEKAVANAKEIGATATDKIGLGLSTTIDKSADAGTIEGTEDGLAQIYTNYSAITTNADGKITSCLIDASQTNINFSKAGKITTDLKAALSTKQELGDSYGMKKASKIGKEWYEQANAFAAYVVGKTPAEVKGIALSDQGTAADADLASSVTIHLGPYMNVIEIAAAKIK